MPATDYAVLVGINRYPSLGDLYGPENDVASFQEWLVDPQGGSTPADNITTVNSTLYYDPLQEPIRARPTTEQVDAAFDKLIEEGMELNGRLGRRLYIFLAGHGFGPDIEDAALLMANAGKFRTGYHIPGRGYANWFRTAALFEEVVLFADCCRDDYHRPPIHVPPWPAIVGQQDTPVRFFYGFATRWKRKARERALGPDGRVHGVFTRALLDALRNSPTDEEGCYTADDIANYVFNYLPRLVNQDEYQEPEFEYNKQSNFVFARRSASPETPICVTFTAADPALAVEILNNDFVEVRKLDALTPTWNTTLKPGARYLIRIVGTEIRKQIDVFGTETIHVSL